MMPPGAYSPAAILDQMAAEGPSPAERWEKGLAIALPIVALSMLLVHFVPVALLIVGLRESAGLTHGAGATERFRDTRMRSWTVRSCFRAILLGTAIALGATFYRDGQAGVQTAPS